LGGEKLSAWALIGALLVLAGVAVIFRLLRDERAALANKELASPAA